MPSSTVALPRLWYLYLFLIPLLSLSIQFIHHYYLQFWQVFSDTQIPSGRMSDSAIPMMGRSSSKIQRTPVYFLGIGGPNFIDNTGMYELHDSSLIQCEISELEF